jgi:holin-like protein
MIQAFAILLVSQLLGEGIAHALALPVPGPVIGLLLLAGALVIGRRLGLVTSDSLGTTPLGRASDGLLRHLSLLFVPAGVGVVQQGHVLLGNGTAIVVALVGSTVLTLVVSVLVFVGTMRLMGKDTEAGETEGEAR